jgi:hypothetical protein
MQNSSLAPEWIEFVDKRGKVEVLMQELIDRAQYHPGFLEFLQLLLTEYDAPFEWKSTVDGRVREIKQSFTKTETSEQSSSDLSDAGVQGEPPIQSMEVSRGGSTLQALQGNYGALE